MSDHGLVGYFEIPATDLPRAAEFYAPLFNWEISRDDSNYWTISGAGGRTMAGLYEPSEPAAHAGGPTIYVSVDDIDKTLQQATELGGQVEKGRTPISPEHGDYSIIRDPEGNRIGLWQR